MELINDINQLKQEVRANQICLLYIQAPDCGLCSIMLNKIEKVVGSFDNVRSVRAEIHVVPEIAGSFLVASAPTVLLFVNGKEIYRAGNFIDTVELNQTIAKWSEILNCQP